MDARQIPRSGFSSIPPPLQEILPLMLSAKISPHPTLWPAECLPMHAPPFFFFFLIFFIFLFPTLKYMLFTELQDIIKSRAELCGQFGMRSVPGSSASDA